MEWSKLLCLETQVIREEEPETFKNYPISDLEKDYQSIISSVAFRRLQDKTQVFPLDKSDFVRTRLTHSMEVSTIARQLGIMITQNRTQYLQEEFRNNDNLPDEIPVVLSCAGLLHDIGNPPFGHFGEVVIGDWFRNELKKDTFLYKGKLVRDTLTAQMREDLQNFEGNAQALRILSKVKIKQDGYDVNLSYSVLNTLVKYPTSSLEFDDENKDVRKHKFGYYYSERKAMDSICSCTETKTETGYVRHPLVFLMEAADDIAYSTADLEDAFKKGLFSLDQFIKYFETEVEEIENKQHRKYSKELIDDLKERICNDNRNSEDNLVAFQKWIGLVKKWLMYVVSYSFSKNYDEIMSGKYKHDLFYDTNHESSIKILKNAMKKFVYNSKEILKLELSAKKILNALLDDFVSAVIYWEDESCLDNEEYKMTKADKKYINIISANYKDDYLHARTENEAENLYLRFLMVTDYISGMTDSYAKNLYQELNGID